MPERTSFLFGTKRYLSSVSPAPPQGHTNIVWQSDGENISAHIADSGGGAVASVFGRTGAVVSVLGDYPPAKLGTGTPSATNYLRGDGVWATVDYSQITGKPAVGSFQTPWLQTIQGAGYALYDAGTLQVTQNRTPPSGAGLEITYDTRGYVNAYDRTAGAFKELQVYGNPLRFYNNGAEVLSTSGASHKVQLEDSGFYLDVDKFFGINVTKADGQWRYRKAGGASLWASAADGNTYLYTAGAGAAGAIISLTESLRFVGDQSIQVYRPLVAYGQGQRVIVMGPVEATLGFNRTDGGADDKLSRILCSGGAIGFERLNDAYTQVLSYARLGRTSFSVNVPLVLTGLPTSASGLASGSVWRDAAAGNVLKIVP